MNSAQVQTSPTLRNFATRISETNIQVTTKLGGQTLVRANFPPSSYPEEAERQLEFLHQLITQTNPGALDFLQEVAGRCLEDTRTALSKILAAPAAA